jgi:hypothetical protein
MANFANHVGTLVTVHGTDSDDTFAFDAAVSRNVTINGVRYHFDDAEVDSVTFDGGQGFDVVEIRDSPGDDTLEAWPDRVVLANTPGEFVVSFTVEVTGFEDMQAYAVGGGSDTAVLHGSASDDKLKSYLSPDDDFVRLRAKDMSYSLRAKLFGRVEGDHGGSGNDMAVFTGSDGDDEFNFDGLTNTAQTQRPGRRHSATGFDRVIAQAGGGDADLAYFTDMPGEGERMDDVFYFKPHKTQLVGQTVNVTARAFDQVHAEDINGGFGVARIYDTAGDEHFEFIGDTARVYRRIGTELDLLYEAVAFERVKAYRSTGNDTKDDTNHAFGDELYLYGWEE